MDLQTLKNIQNPSGVEYVQIGDTIHTYYYDPSSNDFDDGLSCICPYEKIATTIETGFGVSFNNTTTLQKNSIVLGSMDWVNQNSGLSLTDWQLHGNRFKSNSNQPYLDHQTGEVYGWLNTSYDVAYSYAFSSGRWKKAWLPREELTPKLLGGVPNDPEEDNYHILGWLFNRASALGKNILIDDNYWVGSGGVLELSEEQTLRGLGSHTGIHTNAEKLINNFRKDLGNFDPTKGIRNEIDLYLWSSLFTVTAKPGTNKFYIRDLEINGHQELVDWEEINNHDLSNNQTKWAIPQLKNILQNSPNYTGVSLTNQNGRNQTQYHLDIRNTTIKSFPSGCLVAGNDVPRVTSESLTLADSVCGRPLYHACGKHRDLTLKGFARTSMARLAGPLLIDGLTYCCEENQQNPWPNNQQFDRIISIRSGQDNSSTVIKGIDIDLENSVAFEAIGTSVACQLYGTVKSKTGSNLTVPYEVNSGPQKDKSGPSDIQLQVIDRGYKSTPPLFYFPGEGSKINQWRHRQVVRTTNPPQVDWNNKDDRESSIASGIVVSLNRLPEEERGGVTERGHKEQHLEITYDSDWPVAYLIQTIGAYGNQPELLIPNPEDIVPTFLHLKDCVVDNRNAYLWCGNLGHTVQAPTGCGQLPLSILLENCSFNVWPGAPFVGDTNYDAEFEVLKFKNCRTRNSRLTTSEFMKSEQREILSFSSGDDLEYQTSLLWKPKTSHIRPLSALSEELLSTVEYEVILEGDKREDAREPLLKVNLTRALTPGETVQYEWEGLVSP